MKWAQLRRGQLDDFDRTTPVILPTAATEQHGEHLPLATDCLIAQAILDRLDAACGHRLLILPMLEVGCSEHHMRFPGTLTLTHETFKLWVMDVVESVTRHGFKRIVIHNSHGGNSAVNGVLGEKLGQRYPDAQVLVFNWWSAAAQRLLPICEGGLGSVGHACEFETSVIQAVAPQLVDMKLAHDDGIQHRPASMHMDLLHGPAASSYRPFHVMTPTGVFGKPSLASAKKGERVLAAVVESIRELLTGFWPDWLPS